MRTWQEDQLNRLQAAKSEAAVLETLVGLARDLGFDYCAYGLQMPLPLSQPRVVMLNNYPVEWQIRYQQNRYVEVDPTVRHGYRSLLPAIWSDDLFAPVPEFWEEARSYGLRVGWVQSSRDVRGVAGLLTLARATEPLDDVELEHKGFRMAWLTQAVHIAMSDRLTDLLVPGANAELSAREVAVLRWTGDGKTSAEIAEILRISERTVNFHVNNAVAKLGCANKTAATVRAAVLGKLY